jgi:hypothetical protein
MPHRVVDPLVDRRNELARHHAADDGIDELVAAAARQRLEADMHVGELAATARLLLVPVMLLDRLAMVSR